MARSHKRIIKKATPTVRSADGIVKSWDIDVVFVDDLDGWNRTYSFSESDLEWMKKKPTDFTEADLLKFIPGTYDHIFEAHYDSMHPGEPVEEKVADFDLSTLGTKSSKVTL